MSTASYLLLRRGGVLWGIDNAVVTGLTRRGASYRISLGGGLGEDFLSADEVLCVVDDLAVQPAAVLRRFWPGVGAGVTGLAVHGELPLVVVNPRTPPEMLRDTGEGE